jgi:hypothetical protein
MSVYLYVCPSVRAVSGHCPDLCLFVCLFVFFFFGFCFLCQLNCPDLFFFFFDGFCFLCQLNCPDLFFFFLLDGCIMHRVHTSYILKLHVCLSVRLSGQFQSLSGQFLELPGPLFVVVVFFAGGGVCFLCQLNCPDLFFFFFFWGFFLFLK